MRSLHHSVTGKRRTMKAGHSFPSSGYCQPKAAPSVVMQWSCLETCIPPMLPSMYSQILNPQAKPLSNTSHSAVALPAGPSQASHCTPAPSIPSVTGSTQIQVPHQGRSTSETQTGDTKNTKLGQQRAALTQYCRHEALSHLSLAHTPQQTLFCPQPLQFWLK